MTDEDPNLAEDRPGTSSPWPERDFGTESAPVGRRKRTAVLRFAALGTELAATTLIFAGIGYWIDSARGHEKAYATAFGTLIGFTLGMIRFIREVKRAAKD